MTRADGQRSRDQQRDDHKTAGGEAATHQKPPLPPQPPFPPYPEYPSLPPKEAAEVAASTLLKYMG